MFAKPARTIVALPLLVLVMGFASPSLAAPKPGAVPPAAAPAPKAAAGSLRDSGGLSQYLMTVWTSRDGLVSDTLLSGLQDGQGYIWLASYDGLVRFDGESFTAFTASQGGFPGKSPRVLLADRDGSLWIGTNTTGLFRYAEGKFTRYALEDGLPDLSVRCLALDSAGTLWVGTANGVARFVDGRLLAVRGGLAEGLGVASFLLPLEGGEILVGTNRPGLWSIRGGEVAPYLPGRGFESTIFSAAWLDATSGLWLGSASGRLVRVARNEVAETLDFPEIKDASVKAFSGDADGTLWIATDKGIVYRRDGTFGFFNEASGLPGNVVSSIWRDREGSLWATTERAGLVKFSPGKFINLSKRDGLVSDAVNTVAEDPFGGVWVGTDEGVSRLPAAGAAAESALPAWDKAARALVEGLKGTRVRQVRAEPSGDLWISTYSDNALVLLRRDGRVESWSTKRGLPVNKVRNSITRANGEVWVGTGNGAAVISGEKVVVHGKDELPNTVILGMLEDSKRRVWLGMDGGGLALFEDGRFRVFTTKDGLASNVVFRVAEAPAGVFWVSTSDGLTRIKDGAFSSADLAAGLSGESVYEVVAEPSGLLWIVTGRKVVVVRASELDSAVDSEVRAREARTFDRLDGLAGQLSANAWACVNPKGVVYLPTLLGLSVYNPQSVPMNKTPPPVHVERVEVDGKPMALSPARLVLPAQAKRVTFGYTALSYVVPQRVSFEYRLEGFDPGWIGAGAKREISYTNLPPGDYRFKVRAENNDGVVNEAGASVELRRLPLLWETPWFYAGLALLLAVLVWLFVRLRLHALEQRSRELNRLVDERTEELALERDKSEALLRNVLPEAVAEELKSHGRSSPRVYAEATVLFADLVDFTDRSSLLSPVELIGELNDIFTAFDDILGSHGCERIKTLGDGYLAVCGAPAPVRDHAARMVAAACDMLRYLESRNASNGQAWEVRIGIDSGPIVGGVVGVRKYIFDVFGDTVNTAFRLQALGVPMSATVSEATAALLPRGAALVPRPPRTVKGKRELRTFYVRFREGRPEARPRTPFAAFKEARAAWEAGDLSACSAALAAVDLSVAEPELCRAWFSLSSSLAKKEGRDEDAVGFAVMAEQFTSGAIPFA